MFKRLKKWLGFIFSSMQNNKPFICGGEHCIEIIEGNNKSYIWYKSPTSDDLLDYAHCALEYSQSEISSLAKKEIPDFNFQKLHREMLGKKIYPYAKKIILRWENYYTNKNEKVVDIQTLIDSYSTHIEYVVQTAFSVDTTFKKKF